MRSRLRLNNKPAPPATTDPTPGDGNARGRRRQDDDGQTTTDRHGRRPPTEPTVKPGDAGGAEAGALLDTASADSVPVPLLVLGGLALLLVAAGSAGYADPAPPGAPRSAADGL